MSNEFGGLEHTTNIELNEKGKIRRGGFGGLHVSIEE
jgi:hypothetical protein